jgi:hypothetical protein
MRTGRFSKPASEIAQRYSESVSFDWSYIDTILQDRLRTPQRSLRQES